MRTDILSISLREYLRNREFFRYVCPIHRLGYLYVQEFLVSKMDLSSKIISANTRNA